MSEKAIRTKPSCTDEYDPNSLPFAEASQRMKSAVSPVTTIERVPVREALGRIAAQDIRSPLDIPPFANSAMDGYAARSSDLPTQGSVALRVVGRSFAGDPYLGHVGEGECIRIMTGGVMPNGADTVIMQEHAQKHEETIHVGSGHRRGDHVRRAGEDISAASVVVPAGRMLQPADLGVVASLGLAEAPVWRRVRVAFFSTGDELKSVGTVLGKGEIYDSNRYTLWGMLTHLGVDVIDLGVVRDRREDVRQAFTDAAAIADAIITTGGVSVGEADYVKETLEQIGQVRFWKIAVKPGRPLAFGFIGETVFIGLPGNPVSVMVTFRQLAEPALRRMMGQHSVERLRVKVRCASKLKKKPGRLEFQRGILGRDDDGELSVRTTGGQGSHVLTSMSASNCYIVLPEESPGAEPGDIVEVEPFADTV